MLGFSLTGMLVFVVKWCLIAVAAFAVVRLTVFRDAGRLTRWARRARWGLYDSWRRGPEFWGLLEVTGIAVFVGPNGSGKSLAAVAACLRSLDGQVWECRNLAHVHMRGYVEHATVCETCPVGDLDDDEGLPLPLCEHGAALVAEHGTGERLVYSTVELLDGRKPHPRYRQLIDYQQLTLIEHADVLFDEVAGIADASDSAAIPVQVTNWLHQLRKRDVRLRVTSPAYSRCAKPIRQVAQVVIDCRAFFPEPARSGALWRPNQGMAFRAFDAFAFEDYTASTGTRLATIGRSYLWRPGSRAEATYNTLQQVAHLGHVTDSGMCMGCGGSRSRPRCACTGEVEPGDEFEVVERVSGSGSRVREVLPIVRSGVA